jgi:hypothetical protein
MKKKEQKDPTQLTVAELMKTHGVPLPVYLWLERLTGGDKYALEHVEADPATYHIARLVYDVLDTDSAPAFARVDDEINSPHVHFPHEARDFVEEWLYHLVNYYGVHAWNTAEVAVAALPRMVNVGGVSMLPEGDAALLLLRSAVERMTTKRERREFLRDTDESDAEDEKESATNMRAAFKLSRVLADPRTPTETRDKIEDELIEFSSNTRVYITHPALVRRAFLLMSEAKPKGRARDCRRTRKRLLALLDSIPDEKGGVE